MLHRTDTKDTLVYTDNMTREKFCIILANMLKAKDKLPTEQNVKFSDTTRKEVSLLVNGRNYKRL